MKSLALTVLLFIGWQSMPVMAQFSVFGSQRTYPASPRFPYSTRRQVRPNHGTLNTGSSVPSNNQIIELCNNLTKRNDNQLGDGTEDAKVALYNHALDAELTRNRYGYQKDRHHVGNKTVVLGSSDQVVKSKWTLHRGFVETVLKAYNYHYVLRTRPDDWWFLVTQKVALAIDNNSKKSSVRRFFVQHDEGKKKLTVPLGANTIYGADYSTFFRKMSQKIREHVNKPAYVDLMTQKFSTTTSTNQIVYQITLMSSLQEFFEFYGSAACGIPSVEMLGTLRDWQSLETRLAALERLLAPISDDIGLSKWWAKASKVLAKLLDTFQNRPDKEWWSRIMTEKSFGSGEHAFNGWLLRDFLDIDIFRIFMKDIPVSISTVPLFLHDPINDVTEEGALVAGVAGYNVEQGDDDRPTIEAVHAWTLLLNPDSFFRKQQ